MAKLRDERGMVSAELALGSLFVAGFLAIVAWLIALLMAWMACQNLATEVARQVARGDTHAAQEAQREKPPGATVAISQVDDIVHVRVELQARPWAQWLPSVPMSASAAVTAEKG